MAFFKSAIVVLLLSLTGFTFTSSAQPNYNWIKPYIIDYKNGSIFRDTITTQLSFVPPPNSPTLQSKDITLTSSLKGRIFLPLNNNNSNNKRLPILLYFHGGGFCIGSCYSKLDTLFLSRLATKSNTIILSIEYRLYPDATIPTPYDNAWTALDWITSHNQNQNHDPDFSEPWLTQYGDFNKVYIGGESAGANIAHNLAIRVGPSPLPNGVKLNGIILAMPFFLGSTPVALEPSTVSETSNYKIWAYVCPNCSDGVDNANINPTGPWGPKLENLAGKKLLVYTAELDDLRGRGKLYYDEVKKSGWKGEAQWLEAPGKGHVFHIFSPDDPATTHLIQDFSAFLNA